MDLSKVSKIKLAGIAALVIWPIAYLVGYRSAIANLIAGAAVFMWIFQIVGAVPETGSKKKNLGFRNP